MDDKHFQFANEMGRIFHSLQDRKTLCDFFPESVSIVVPAANVYLFLKSSAEALWLESSFGPEPTPAPDLRAQALEVLESGKPVLTGASAIAPLFIRNDVIGVVCVRRLSGDPLVPRDFQTILELCSQMASALKNAMLLEQNVNMARLAAIGQSMGMVVHEIKNIMQIGILSEGLLRLGAENGDKESIERGIEGVGKAFKQIQGFTHEILSLTHDYRFTPKPIDWPYLLEELRKDLSGKAESAQVELDFRAAEDLKGISGEAHSIYRALLNLVKNAMEACNKDKSWVRIRVRRIDPEHYEVIIQDNGQGMPEEVKARMFEAFFTTKGEKGTGLGMMVVDKTVRSHGGRIEFESQAGEGATFRLILPNTVST
ncbi:MAG: ATP-binding protein [Candidatus Omnitrophota bacterium]